MGRGAAIAWIAPGFTISVIDCWLSMQSMFGLIDPINPLQWVAAVIMGFALTFVAVVAPILKDSMRHPLVKGIWLIVLLLDLATSVLGAIWYGAMGQDLTEPIEISRIEYQPANAQVTVVFVLFVAIVAVCCVQFGRALRTLTDLRRP